jgi:Leucine-rich repeat (LRR) protein
MFKNLHTLDVSENALPFAKLGSITNLRRLNFSCNGLKSLDLEVEDRFTHLETLDLSYNHIDRAAIIVLATLPNLKYLDLTSNKIQFIAPEIQDMEHWKDHVITLILPFQVAALGLHVNEPASTNTTSSKAAIASEGLAPPHSASAKAATLNQLISQQLIDENMLYQANSMGFQNLECLILEKNPLGAADPKNIWTILAKLPR